VKFESLLNNRLMCIPSFFVTIQAEVVKVESLDEIVGRGVLMTPSLFVDGEEVVAGRVPTVNEIIEILKESV